MDYLSICGVATGLAQVFALYITKLSSFVASHSCLGAAGRSASCRLWALSVLPASSGSWLLASCDRRMVLSHDWFFCLLARFSHVRGCVLVSVVVTSRR